MNYTSKQLRAKAAICRKNAAGKTGAAYHRELQKAQGFESQASEREKDLWCDRKEGGENGTTRIYVTN